MEEPGRRSQETKVWSAGKSFWGRQHCPSSDILPGNFDWQIGPNDDGVAVRPNLHRHNARCDLVAGRATTLPPLPATSIPAWG